MIVEIIPLKRLPATLHRFDYTIPDDFVVAVGDVVVIPWRKGSVHGVVAHIKKEADVALNKTKPLEKILIPRAVPLWLVALWHTMALFYHVSEATLAKTSLPVFPKKNISVSPARARTKSISLPAPISYINYANEKSRLNFIVRTLKKPGTHVFIAPSHDELTSVQQALTDAGIAHETYFSELTPKQKRKIWINVCNGATRVIVGTKSALFLPFPTLTSLLIDKEWSPHHKNWDAQPLYHAVDVAQMIRQLTGARVTLMSTSPTVATYGRIQAGEIAKEKKSSLCAARSFAVISMDEDKKRGNRGTISEHVVHWLTAHPTTSVFFFLNRKGSGHTLQCSDCGATGKCKTCKLTLVVYKNEKKLKCSVCHYERAIPPVCPVCRSVELKIKGMGTEQVRDDLSALSKKLGAQLPVIQLDSDTGESTLPEKAWFIGTDFAMARIPWHTIGAVVVVNADALLLQANYRASEQTYARLVDFLYRLQETQGTLMVQTYSPQHALFAALYRQKPALFFDEELKTRTALSYPPATFVVRMEGAGAHTVHARLAAFIKEKGLNARLEGPYASKSLLLRFSPKTVQLELIALTTLLPPDWKVDPNPTSALS